MHGACRRNSAEGRRFRRRETSLRLRFRPTSFSLSPSNFASNSIPLLTTGPVRPSQYSSSCWSPLGRRENMPPLNLSLFLFHFHPHTITYLFTLLIVWLIINTLLSHLLLHQYPKYFCFSSTFLIILHQDCLLSVFFFSRSSVKHSVKTY